MTKLQEAFSLREAAEILGVNPVTVRRLILSKKLKAGRVGSNYRLSKFDLNEYYIGQGGGKLFDIEASTAEIPQAPKKPRPGRKKKARKGN